MERPICAGCFVSLSCGVWMSVPLFDFWESRLSDFPISPSFCPLQRSPGRRGDHAAPPLPVSVRLPVLTNRLLARRLPLLEMEVVEAEPEAEGALRR